MKKFIYIKGSACQPCKVFQKTWESFISNLKFNQFEVVIDPEPEYCAKYGIRSVPSILVLEGDTHVVLTGASLRLANLIAQL